MKSVGLRRRRRQTATPNASGQCNAPVTVVFRTHTDSVAKVSFLYSPKNYNLPMPTETDGFKETILELCMPEAGNPVTSNNTGNDNMGNNMSFANRSRLQTVSNVSFTSSGTALGSVTLSPTHRIQTLPSSETAGPKNVVQTGISSKGDTHSLNAPPPPPPPSQQQQTGLNTSPLGTRAAAFPSYDSWVCRAYCFGEKDALHTNGAISVHQSLANKSQFINDIAKGKALVRVVPTYDEVRERFGLSHVELAFEEQCVSRADMFLVAEALRDHILYEGQEVVMCGFTMKVNEMLRVVKPIIMDGASPAAAHQVDGSKQNKVITDSDCMHKTADITWMSTKVSGTQRTTSATASQQQQQQQNQEDEGESRYRRVQCGMVTELTLVNFFSLSAEHFIIVEISKEMWNPTEDGRIKLSWAMKNFLGEYLVHQVHKHKASPLIRIVMVGRLHPQYAIKGQVDILNMMRIPRDYRLASVVEEIELQCEALLRRVLQEVKETLRTREGSVSFSPMTTINSEEKITGSEKNVFVGSSTNIADTLTEQDIFVHAKNTCTIETISLVLEECGKSHVDRYTGYIISVVSAGKGLYQVTNDLMQLVCMRLFNAGIKKVNIICIGRPPLHVTPLLEYVSEDEVFRPQYPLQVDQHSRRFYEKPEWACCFFYCPVEDVTCGGALSFELLTKEEWQQRHHPVRGNSLGVVSGLGLPMAPLSSVLLPVMEPRKVGQVCSKFTMASDLDVHSFPAFTSAPMGTSGANGGLKYPIRFSRFSDVQTATQLLRRISATSSEEESRLKGEVSHAVGKFDTVHVDGVAKTSVAVKQQQQPFLCAAWYCQNSGEGRYQRLSRHGVYEFILNHHMDSFADGRAGHTSVQLEAAGIIPCGLNIFDTDVRCGYMFLKLHINQAVLPGVCWSMHILNNTDMWAQLMGAFSDKDSCLLLEEQSYFVSNFSAAEIFSRDLSVILNGGETLVLASRRSDVTFFTPREIVFTFRPALFVSLDEVTPPPFSATVAYVQIRNSSLFAIKTINPYRPMAGTRVLLATSRSVTTDVLLRRRWQFAHPEISSASTQRSLWAALCYCKILPIYGTKSVYPPHSFLAESTHQYAISIADSMNVLEYVLQRLHQQYQIVVSGSSLAGIQWPREQPTQNAHLEMSICHQVHELKISETGHSISVRRMLHRVMYSNAPRAHGITYSYLLLNYLDSGFSVHEVNLRTLIGKKNAFQWESLDAYIRERHRPDVFIPRFRQQSLFGAEICIALLPDVFETPPLTFQEFVKFLNDRFSAHFSAQSYIMLKDDNSDLTTNIPEEMDSPDTLSLCSVTLYNDNPLSLKTQCVLDHKTGQTICLEAPSRNRLMSVEILLSEVYNPKCHYVLKVSWLACSAPLITDWIRSISVSAMRCRLRAVPIPRYFPSTSYSRFIPRYSVRVNNGEKESCFRRRLLLLLTDSTYRYFPDVPVMNRNCRLLHFSGLCCVTSEPDSNVVAQWFENSLLRTGQPEHQQLLYEFIQAVQHVRNEMASS